MSKISEFWRVEYGFTMNGKITWISFFDADHVMDESRAYQLYRNACENHARSGKMFSDQIRLVKVIEYVEIIEQTNQADTKDNVDHS